MGKAKELLGLIALITEEGEGQGPLSLSAGSKVKFQKDGADVVGEVCAGEDGNIYDQAADAYCVKVGDAIEMVKSSELSVAESKPANRRPGKPNRFKKTLKTERRTNEEGEEEIPAGEPAAADDVHGQMAEKCGMVKGMLGEMDSMCDGDMCPATKGMIGEMMGAADALMPQYENELNLPGDGGGAGVGGNTADDGGGGTPA